MAGIGRDGITLGILAGGRATRLGGRDKAWLRRDGISQVERLQRKFRGEVARVLASANRGPERYAALGIEVVADRVEGFGPVAGLHALAHACATPWLFTVPVDVVDLNECLLRTLVAAARGNGACAVDDDGPQPLVALWRTQALRAACADAIARDLHAVRVLTNALAMAECRFEGVRFGNLNTPEDLAAAGIDAGPD